MLGLMRKHLGWGLKALLVVIIVTFVFFFGYNTLTEQSPDAAALQVGEEAIPFTAFRLFYDEQLESLRATMKDGVIPDFLIKNIQASTQRQLVTRALINQFARQLGLRVTDQELADHIVKEKDFDPVAYKNFIQNFYVRYGIPYEGLIREDLIVKDFQEWVQNVEPIDTAKPKPEKASSKGPERPDPPVFPLFRITDAWFDAFAAKTKVVSHITPDTL